MVYIALKPPGRRGAEASIGPLPGDTPGNGGRASKIGGVPLQRGGLRSLNGGGDAATAPSSGFGRGHARLAALGAPMSRQPGADRSPWPTASREQRGRSQRVGGLPSPRSSAARDCSHHPGRDFTYPLSSGPTVPLGRSAELVLALRPDPLAPRDFPRPLLRRTRDLRNESIVLTPPPAGDDTGRAAPVAQTTQTKTPAREAGDKEEN
jgi:hypothetical protein